MPSIPPAVRKQAALALSLKKAGYAGGTAAGLARARQLARCKTVSAKDFATIRAFFARHSHTSQPGYARFVEAVRGKRRDELRAKSKWRGAVAWLLWGGSPAARWTGVKVTAPTVGVKSAEALCTKTTTKAKAQGKKTKKQSERSLKDAKRT